MIRLTAAALSDPGRAREINEDRIWTQVHQASEGEPAGLFVVCDGMGGHLAGEFASQWAVEAVKAELNDLFVPRSRRTTVMLREADDTSVPANSRVTRQSIGIEMEDRLKNAVEAANLAVFNYARKKPAEAGDAGTTLTAALVRGRWAAVANVGDSRTYLLRNHRLRQITQDHSLVASLVASGQIQPEAVFSHPQRNVIYRSMGQKPQVNVDTFLEMLQEGDVLMLCSDGLWEMLQDPKLMAQLIEGAPNLDKAAHTLVDAANAAGGEDNISVVLVKAS